MLQYIHFSRRFIKQLQSLAKSDRKEILAAGQTELIIAQFRNYGVETEEIGSKRTRHGDLRLKNCRKYDLGGGYRLITQQEGGRLLFACAGSHDDTDLWLEWNRGTTIGTELQLGPGETIQFSKRPGVVHVRRKRSGRRAIPSSNTKRICCAALTRRPCARSSAIFTISDSRKQL